MGKLPSISWWSSMRQSHADDAADSDYADMGTAFGLDASLSPPEDGWPSTEDEAPPPERRRRAD